MTNTQPEKSREELLGIRRRPWHRRGAVWAGLAAAAVAGGVLWWQASQPGSAGRWESVPASVGDLRVVVTADGTLNPVREVSIGSELSGIVSEVRVDVNSQVKQGDVLIVLDTAKLEAAVNQRRAELASARAQLSSARAGLYEAQTKDRRMQELAKSSGGLMPSPSELENQKAAVLRAKAEIEVAQAGIENAKASLETAETDLSKAYIRSPVDGVVLARSVEPGYAVAASLQAVELLTVATDLRELQLEVDVDEADVGSVKTGQKASFTVAAYPDRPFAADFYKLAYGASNSSSSGSSSSSMSGSSSSASTSGVVTYTGYLAVRNEDLLLRPGMTATASIETAALEKVLLVPNAALRFSPRAETKKSAAGAMFGMPHRSGKKVKESLAAQTHRRREVWVLRNGAPEKVDVVTGLTDGTRTQIVEGDLREGDLVVTDQLRAAAE